MRPAPFVLALLLALGAGGAVVGQAVPPPHEEMVCAYKPGSGRMELVRMRQSWTAAGGYDGPRKVVIGGTALTAAEAGYVFARGKAWHVQNKPITLNGKTYVKPNPAEKFPQFVGGFGDMKYVGEYDGVPLFTMDGRTYPADRYPPGTLYVLYGLLACEFEPYVPKP